MDKFAREAAFERAAIFGETGARRGVANIIIEKDFWVCWTLRSFEPIVQFCLSIARDIGRLFDLKGVVASQVGAKRSSPEGSEFAMSRFFDFFWTVYPSEAAKVMPTPVPVHEDAIETETGGPPAKSQRSLA